MNEIKKTLLDALWQARGDDLARAKLEFKGMGYLKMHQQHGHSGLTRQEILDGYQDHETKIDRAKTWVEGRLS